MGVVGVHRDHAGPRSLLDRRERGDHRAAAERGVDQRHQQRVLDQLLELAPVVEHPVHREALVRQQRAQRRGAHLVGELRRDRALDHGVALLLHLADLAGEALALRRDGRGRGSRPCGGHGGRAAARGSRRPPRSRAGRCMRTASLPCMAATSRRIVLHRAGRQHADELAAGERRPGSRPRPSRRRAGSKPRATVIALAVVARGPGADVVRQLQVRRRIGEALAERERRRQLVLALLARPARGSGGPRRARRRRGTRTDQAACTSTGSLASAKPS